MTSYKFGDLVLVAFPHTSSATIKKRPALVLLDIGDNDMVLAPITSQIRSFQGDLLLQDWKLCGLLMESWVRLAKVSCLEKSQISKHLGHLSSTDKQKVISLWRSLYLF
jgi:mRNA interferase MazF